MVDIPPLSTKRFTNTYINFIVRTTKEWSIFISFYHFSLTLYLKKKMRYYYKTDVFLYLCRDLASCQISRINFFRMRKEYRIGINDKLKTSFFKSVIMFFFEPQNDNFQNKNTENKKTWFNCFLCIFVPPSPNGVKTEKRIAVILYVLSKVQV